MNSTQKKRTEAEKNRDKNGAALSNAVYSKMMENFRNRINVKLVNNEKDYFKCTLKPSHMSHKIFDNNLVAKQKSRVLLKLNKLLYIGMCILKLSKVLMDEFICDAIKNKYDNKSKLLFTDTDSLMYEIKTEEIFDFSNYSTKSKYYHNSNK